MKDAQRNIVGISFVETQKADLPAMDFPTTWNVPLESHHIKRTKVGVLFVGLGTLKADVS